MKKNANNNFGLIKGLYSLLWIVACDEFQSFSMSTRQSYFYQTNKDYLYRSSHQILGKKNKESQKLCILYYKMRIENACRDFQFSFDITPTQQCFTVTLWYLKTLN